jgi:hypothetical protein
MNVAIVRERAQYFTGIKQETGLCGLAVRVPVYRTEMYCVSCEVRTEFIYIMQKKVDRLCGLVVRVPGYRTEMYCVSCEVQTLLYMLCRIKYTASVV